ncbi:YceD family protein [soil metagenome]|jgi:uncharacterized protein|nr:DUF177 domain-containing protein [Euzebyaceae bacterium]
MTPTHDTILQVADLLDRPGVSRRVRLVLPAPDGLTLPLAEVVEPLRFAGSVESVVEGLLVRGRLAATLRLACARCLTEVSDEVVADLAELFSDPATVDPDAELDPGYEIAEGRIDLDTLLRDALVPAVPIRPLCTEACRGLCASCGADRNETDCDCADQRSDPRWSALERLRLPAEGT